MAHPLRPFRPRRTALAAALAALSLGAAAQAPVTSITITGRPIATLGIGGFGDQPLARTPLTASVLGAGALADAGITSLGEIGRLDAGVGDSYNAPGYWAGFTLRGYALDNRANFRRDGLPINGETAIALDNKERVELLKGTSGIQAGVSAPGGLVNLVVKRPNGPVRSATLGWEQSGSLLGAVDWADRFGADGAFGLRVNAAYEHLDPITRDTQGHRRLLAVAGDWRLGTGTRLEAEIETSHQQQPSVVAFSMLGDAIPDPSRLDPRLNLNRQPWGLPVVMDGTTASLRWTQALAEGWRFTAHAMTQRLKTDDRTAFPYGDYDADYNCTWCDRYAPDGSFSYWQYVSENERRRSDALDLRVSGQVRTGALAHQFEAGVLRSRASTRPQDQVFDVSTGPLGSVYDLVDVQPSSGFLDANTIRDERSTEWYLRDAIALGDAWQLWAGLRHTRLDRASRRTRPDGNDSLRETDYRQSFTTPWLALGLQLTPATLLYASWGRGIETDVAPNRPQFTNRGEALPALKSRQVEVGAKYEDNGLSAALALFDIDRPVAGNLGECSSVEPGEPANCTRQVDGSARHRGVEAQVGARLGAWTLQASAMWLDAERRGSADAAVNGTRPVNVPEASLRLGAGYRVAAVPGLELSAALTAEGDRVVLPYDTGVRIPGWSRTDLGARWEQRTGPTTMVWRVGVDNVFDRRAWKESPYQFDHVYLYPLAPRQWRASVQASF